MGHIYHRDWEVSTSDGEVRVKGRLKENVDYWRDIGCNEAILRVLREGYRIPFLGYPVPRGFS